MNKKDPHIYTVRRMRALDGLRGMAAVLVVIYHADWPNQFTALNLVKNGYLAVDLFFILSGLVISENYSTKITYISDPHSILHQAAFFPIVPSPYHYVRNFCSHMNLQKLIAQRKFGLRSWAGTVFRW